MVRVSEGVATVAPHRRDRAVLHLHRYHGVVRPLACRGTWWPAAICSRRLPRNWQPGTAYRSGRIKRPLWKRGPAFLWRKRVSSNRPEGLRQTRRTAQCRTPPPPLRLFAARRDGFLLECLPEIVQAGGVDARDDLFRLVVGCALFGFEVRAPHHGRPILRLPHYDCRNVACHR